MRIGPAGVGQFLPLLLHRPGHDPLPAAMAAVAAMARSGARVLVVTAASGHTSDARRPRLDESGWQILLANLNRHSLRIVHCHLERAGYAGWYVLEHVIALDADPLEPGAGGKDAPDPAADRQASLEHLLAVANQDDDAGGAMRT